MGKVMNYMSTDKPMTLLVIALTNDSCVLGAC